MISIDTSALREPISLSPEDFQTLTENNKTLCVIDVREQDEWDSGHLNMALHIPKDQLPEKIKESCPDLDQPICLYCRAGLRSLAAARILIALGYKNIYSLKGGLTEWIKFKH